MYLPLEFTKVKVEKVIGTLVVHLQTYIVLHFRIKIQNFAKQYYCFLVDE